MYRRVDNVRRTSTNSSACSRVKNYIYIYICFMFKKATCCISVHTITCFRVLGLRREEPATTAAATCRASRISNLAQRQQQAAETATVVVQTATSTPDLRQLRRLPRQARHRAGASSPTIKTALSFFIRRMLCMQFVHFCLFFSESGSLFGLGYHGTCYANNSAVNIDRIRREALT